MLFLAPTPLGVLELIGVIGLIWWRGRVWWGKPLLLLTAGVYAYWLLGLAAFVLANRHLLLQVQDTPPLTGLVLAAAGVLTIAQAAPAIVRKISIRTVPAGLRPRPVPAHHLDRCHRMAGVDAGRPRLDDRALPARRERSAQ